MIETGNSILVIDDEPDLLTSMQRILRLDGYHVDTADSIASALDRSSWDDYFAILLDRKLPDGMGEDLLPQLRKAAPKAGLIVITAHADLESSLATLRHGADDYLLKPIDPDAVRHRLKQILEMRKSEARVRQAERLAGIGQMMAVLSHEARNFLQRIQAAAELARLDADDPHAVTLELDKIDRATTGLSALLGEVRNYAAPIRLDRTQVNLRNIWSHCWHEIQQHYPERRAQLVDCCPDVNTDCRADAFRMQQVFRNILENAVAACDDPLIVKIESEPTVWMGHDAVAISICDNGPGLSTVQKNNVFEPFFTTKPKGTGLGMAIVKRIVQAHEGWIHVAENNGDGACFRLTLPR